jgi:IclR family pca regulon transcriptional regulator
LIRRNLPPREPEIWRRGGFRATRGFDAHERQPHKCSFFAQIVQRAVVASRYPTYAICDYHSRRLGLEACLDTSLSRAQADRQDIMGGFAKGLSVIEAFDQDRDKLTIADIARLTGFDRATARRCLLTLVDRGFASTDGKRFSLTARILRLGYAYLASTPLPRLVQPYLEQLSEATQESCSASILDNGEIVYVARAAQRRVMSIGLNVGSRLPAYCTSMGRVLLAARPEDEAHAILRCAVRDKLTPYTVTDIDELIAILRRTRSDGYSVNDQELEIGLRSIAVPLFDREGHAIAAINVGVQAARVSVDHLIEHVLPAMRSVQLQVTRLWP